MATMASAQDKYARKMATAAQAYNAAKGRMTANYQRGVSEFLGGPVAGHVVAAYQAGIAAAQYKGGDPQKWAANYRAKMMGQ